MKFFDDSLALGREDEVDSDMLEELAKNSPFPTVQARGGHDG